MIDLVECAPLVKMLLLRLPPPAEQEAIAAHIEKKLAEVKRILSAIETQIATLTAYRKSLIHECVTGQRRITEPPSPRGNGGPGDDTKKGRAHG